jgi:hypothetical protein
MSRIQKINTEIRSFLKRERDFAISPSFLGFSGLKKVTVENGGYFL